MKKVIVLIVISLILTSCNKTEIAECEVTDSKSVEADINEVDLDEHVSDEKDDDVRVVDSEVQTNCISSEYNSANDGIATLYNNMLIYTDFEKQKLVGVEQNGDSRTIISEKPYFDLQIHNGWIYGTAYESDGLFYLFRIRPDGTDEEKIVENEVTNFQIVGDDIIYCHANGTIFELSLVNNDIQLVYKTGIEYIKILVRNDWIYYYDYLNNNLMKLHIRGDEIETLFHQVLRSFIADDEDIFYSTGEGIYVFDSSNNSHNLIVEGSISSFNIIDEIVFFGDYKENVLYKYNMATMKREVISDSRASRINIVCNNIIYESMSSERHFTDIIKIHE